MCEDNQIGRHTVHFRFNFKEGDISEPYTGSSEGSYADQDSKPIIDIMARCGLF